jgi:hypothetical protein
MNEAMQQYAMKLARYAAVVIGAWLVKRGFPDGGSPDFVDILAGAIVAGIPLVWSWVRTKVFVAKTEQTAQLTHALALELEPVPTTPRADAIINKLVVDTAKSLPATGIDSAKVDAALVEVKP